MTSAGLFTACRLLGLVFLISAWSWSQGRGVLASEVDPNFHLYLLIGQSNMAGRGTVDAQSQESDPRVLMFNREQQWVPAKDPLHFDKPEAGVGPGFAFGKAMATANPTVRIGLIPCAVGGTSITLWTPGAFDKATKTHPYDDMLARVTSALQHGVLKGILWHQGESNRGKPEGYPEALTQLIERLRTALTAPSVGFVAGELAAFTSQQEAPTATFNAQLHQLAGTIPSFGVVSAAGLQHRGDRLHFDTASARLLGERFAKAMLALPAGKP